jgi:Zn-finger nucleic acid-binding protein
MKAKAKASSTKEMKFELKYCERCGGLWLRPVGGEQIYCTACWREMAQLPRASWERAGVEAARMPRGPRWDDKDFEDEGDEGVDLDAAGGVA